MTWWTPVHIGETTAVETALLAVVTSVMAWATFVMARATSKLAKQEEKHHQDGAMPICLLDEAAGSRAKTVEFVECTDNGQPVFQYRIFGPIRNIGQGSALNLRLILRFPTFSNHEVVYEFDPLGAGEARGIPPVRDPARSVSGTWTDCLIAIIAVRPATGFNDTTIKMSKEAWGNIFLEYTDIFGNHFYTQHTKDPRIQWMQFGKGSRPL